LSDLNTGFITCVTFLENQYLYIGGGSLNSQGWPWASDRLTIYTGGETNF
jgi:hypothetical protein